jgi:hypothetical protein
MSATENIGWPAVKPLPATLEEVCMAIPGAMLVGRPEDPEIAIWLDGGSPDPDAILERGGRLWVRDGLDRQTVRAKIDRLLCANLEPRGRA